ncbi:MAG: DUF86 domain-containing protein [Phycisphaerales bacterium]|nr:DUF86 domain-containing protein [Phycisphaerales bacterium]
MPLDQADVKYLWDMLDAARRVVRYTHGFDEAAFRGDDKTQAAVERRVEVIGEAARRVSQTTRSTMPQLAWGAIVGTRHILAHEYGEIDQAQMWRIATVHVPALEPALRDHPPPSEASKDLGAP